MSTKGKYIINSQSNGFTIVELLIVVVVIAILAAITIVAYNGVTKRASEATAQSALSSAQKKLATYLIDNPDTPPSDLSVLGLNNSGVKYQYTVNNTTTPKGYCITATSNGTSFYIASQFTYYNSGTQTINAPSFTTGACPGHGATGTAVTNYVANPSAEASTAGFYAGPGSTSYTTTTAKAYEGTKSVIVTLPQGAGNQYGVGFLMLSDFTTTLKPNTTYTASGWVWVPTGTVDIKLFPQGSGRASAASTVETSLKDQWVRLSVPFTTGTSGVINIYFLNAFPTATGTTQFYADAFMVSEGTQVYTYANGNSAGWAWSGASGQSLSSGPAL